MLEHVELRGDELEAERGAPQKPERTGDVAGAHGRRRLLGVAPAELQPELRRLVRHLEQQLVAVHPLARALLQGEQLLRVQIPLVVGAGGAREDRLGVVLGGVTGHARSILVA